jgi:hypothetical protein
VAKVLMVREKMPTSISTWMASRLNLVQMKKIDR